MISLGKMPTVMEGEEEAKGVVEVAEGDEVFVECLDVCKIQS